MSFNSDDGMPIPRFLSQPVPQTPPTPIEKLPHVTRPEPTPPPKLDTRKMTPEQAIQAQIAMLGTLNAIGMILGLRLLLFIAVGIAAALAFMVHDNYSAGVFAAWTLVVLPLLCALDFFGRKPPPGGP